MKIKIILISFFLISLPIKADQNDYRLEGLFEELQIENDQNKYRMLINKIWDIWLEPTDLKTERYFIVALSLMKKYQYKQSITFFSRIIDNNPDFAEAWNKRATVYYLIGDYEKSINDINQTLILEPRHFGAMDGLGLILIELKKYSYALNIYKEILKILPYSIEIKNKIQMLEKITIENI